MDPRTISVADYTYELPSERIAQQPLADRDGGRLLLLRRGGISDHRFRELPALLPPRTLLVMNDTRVVHARLAFRRATGALIECMVLTPPEERPIEQALLDRGAAEWWCMVGNAKRWKGEELVAERSGNSLRMRSIRAMGGEHLVRFEWTHEAPFLEVLSAFGDLPLPPYMKRQATDQDDARYNTVFAERDGSVAAPTASLHLSTGLLGSFERRGVRTARVTLHVGAGTFLPVKSPTMAGHAMHTEQVRVPLDTVRALRRQLDVGPIVPVGTTALRTIESLYWCGAERLMGDRSKPPSVDVAQWSPYDGVEQPSVSDALGALEADMVEHGMAAITGRTALLIAPGYRFRLASGLITNFHQPNSTLLLLVAALVGPEWRRIYDHALRSGYRFLSYGDGSLLLPDEGVDNRAG